MDSANEKDRVNFTLERNDLDEKKNAADPEFEEEQDDDIDEEDDYLEDEEDEEKDEVEFERRLDTEFPLSGGETDQV